MNEEKKRIMDMLAEGKLTTQEAMQLLDQLEGPPARPHVNTNHTRQETKRASGERMLRVRIVVMEEGNPKPTNITVNLPLAIARVAGKFLSLLPEQARDAVEDRGIDLGAIDWEEAIDALADTGGDIVNITHEDEDEQVTVRIYVE